MAPAAANDKNWEGPKTYLFVKLHKSRFVELLTVSVPMINVLSMTETLVHFGLVGQEVLLDGTRQRV